MLSNRELIYVLKLSMKILYNLYILLCNIGRLFWKAIAELVPPTPSVTQLLNIYLKYVHLDMYICPSVGWNFITDDEARLILNVINQEPNNFVFGKERFLAREDYIVSLKDIHEFHTFINVCFNRLLCKNEMDHKEKCGFIQINNFESNVPYCIIDNQKYVPLFYFKKETKDLIHRAIKIENWNLAYFKFCWKIQGIRDELFAGNSCTVISPDNIKKYFPPETHFEDYWPHETLNLHLSITQNSSTHLKLCFKMLGIRDELFTGDSCKVASLDNIKENFPPETHFEDYWPHETLNSHLNIDQNFSNYANLLGVLIGVPPQAEPTEFTDDPVTGSGCSDEKMELTVIAVSPRRRRSLWSRTKRLFRKMSCCGALIYPTNKIILVDFLPYLIIGKNEIVGKWCFK